MKFRKILLLVCCLLPLFVSASQRPPEASGLNQLLQKKNLATCAPLVEQVANFTIAKNPHQTFMMDSQSEKNSKKKIWGSLTITNALPEKEHLKVSGYVNAFGKCDAVYNRTFVKNESCEKVVGQLFPGWDQKLDKSTNTPTYFMTNPTQPGFVGTLSQVHTSGVCLVTVSQLVLQE